MHNAKARFSDRVENYIKYRPSYPAQAIEILKTACGLKPHAIVADVGSGTGILSKQLLDQGCHVRGIEPNGPMRQAAENLLKDQLRFTSIDGCAEATTLDDASVDMVVAGQAFHWFDRAKAKKEFKRISKTGGGGYVVLVWNQRRIDTSSFLVGYESLLNQLGIDYQAVNHTHISEDEIRDFYAPLPLTCKTFSHTQAFDLQGLIGRAMSCSYVPGEGHCHHGPMKQCLTELFQMHQQDGKVHFDYDTVVYYGRLL